VGHDILDKSGALTPLEGAMTSLFAATSPVVWEEREKYGGEYLMPFGAVETPSEDAQNAELAEELWVTSERVVKEVVGKLEEYVRGASGMER
jgi:hypothetical protein